MSSLEEFEFSLVTIDNDLPSPPPPLCRENSGTKISIILKHHNNYLLFSHVIATSDFIDHILTEFSINPDNDDPLLSQFDPKVLDSFSDEPVEGFDEAQTNIFTRELQDLLEQTVSNAEDQMTESTEKVSLDVSSESLQLLTPPDPYQRVRYDGEHDEDLF
ncbi:hypothetical protein I4U23_011314 [Adineta vaga]|nr:hypothetical protein I4U23_011314 [Adineta vaga]